MKALRLQVSGLKDPINKLTSLLRSGFLVVSESPRIVVRITEPPVITFPSDRIVATFKGATVEKPGKDLDLKTIEVTAEQILIYTEWFFGIDADIVIDLI